MVSKGFKTRVVGSIVMAALCMLVTGCGSDDNSGYVLLAAKQQEAVKSVNNTVILKSLGGGFFQSKVLGAAAGKSALSATFNSMSSSLGKVPRTQTAAYKYSVDSQGRLTKQSVAMSGFGNYSATFVYDKTSSAVSSAHSSANNTNSTYTYDASGRITGYTNSAEAMTVAYSNSGRTEATTNNSTKVTTTYNYDTHDNPVSFTDGTSTTSYEYSYDISGNATDVKQYFQASKDAKKVLQSRTESTYGLLGVVTQKITSYASDGTTVAGTYEITNAYGGLTGQVTQTTYIIKDGADKQTMKYVVNNTYDSGNITAYDYIFYDDSGNVNSKGRQDMTYVLLVSGKDNQ